MKKKFFVLTIIMMTAAPVAVFAQRGQCPQGFHGAGQGYGPGPNPEMKAYLEENVLPVFVAEREALDQQISQEDKTRLDEIRGELRSMRTMMSNKREAMRESDERPTTEQRREMREHRNKIHGLMDEVTEISFKYDGAISQALENLKQDAETWKNQAIDFRRQQCPQMNRGMGQMRRGHARGMMQDERYPLRRFFSPEGFLLFDPDEPLPFMGEISPALDADQFNLFPNPASAIVQVSLNLDEDSDVTVELVDKNGEVLRTKTKQNSGKGIFTETLDLEGLNTGVYFVKLEAGGEKQTRRLVVR